MDFCHLIAHMIPGSTRSFQAQWATDTSWPHSGMMQTLDLAMGRSSMKYTKQDIN